MPLMVDLKRVVIFGGERGEGREKCEKLACYADELLVVPERPFRGEAIELEAGALPHLSERLALARRRRIPVAAEPAAPGNIERFVAGATFVVSDLADRSLNEQISRTCRTQGTLCNVIDTKDLCSVWFMSLIDTPHLTAAISSKGACAYYAKRTRTELEAELDRREPVAAILTEARARIPAGVDRASVLERIYRDEVFTKHVAAWDWESAGSRAEAVRKVACGEPAAAEPSAVDAAGGRGGEERDGAAPASGIDRDKAPARAEEAAWRESSTT